MPQLTAQFGRPGLDTGMETKERAPSTRVLRAAAPTSQPSLLGLLPTYTLYLIVVVGSSALRVIEMAKNSRNVNASIPQLLLPPVYNIVADGRALVSRTVRNLVF